MSTHPPPPSRPPPPLPSPSLTSPSPSLSSPHLQPKPTPLPSVPTLKSLAASSNAIYIRDLRALYEHAKDRFGDVRWVDGEGMNLEGGGLEESFLSGRGGRDDGVWGHKAIIYARAPKSFKSRFFPSTSHSSSSRPSSTAPTIPTPSLSSQHTFHLPTHTQKLTTLPDLNMRQLLTQSIEGMYDIESAVGSGMMLLEAQAEGGVGEEGGGLLMGMGGEMGVRGSGMILNMSRSGKGNAAAGVGASTLPRAMGKGKGRQEGLGFGLGLGIGLTTPNREGQDGMEWLSPSNGKGMNDHSAQGGLLPGFGLGSGSEEEERRVEVRRLMLDKQSQDLVYMWRSKLYADVHIRLPNPNPSATPTTPSYHTNKSQKPPPSAFRQSPKLRRATSFSSAPAGARLNSSLSHSRFDAETDQDLGYELEEDTGDMVFSAHRCLLSSRSPYFAQVLLNLGEFQPHAAGAGNDLRRVTSTTSTVGKQNIPDISLPTPPFTAQAVHFILGYIYFGSLGRFSSKVLDMPTALLVRKCATYLEMEALEREVEGRLIWEFCHGIAWDDRVNRHEGREKAGVRVGGGNRVRGCRCRKCVKRIPRLLRFASSPDVQAMEMLALSREYVIRGWGDCLGKDMGLLDEELFEEIIQDIIGRIAPASVFERIKAVDAARLRLQVEGKEGEEWFEVVEDAVERIDQRLRAVCIEQAEAVVRSQEMEKVLDEVDLTGYEALMGLCEVWKEATVRIELCRLAPRVLQAVELYLLQRKLPDSEDHTLVLGSRARNLVEDTKEHVLRNISKRFPQIREEKGFDGLDQPILSMIAEVLQLDASELLTPLPARKASASLHSLAKGKGVAAKLQAEARPRVSSLGTSKINRSASGPVLGTPLGLSPGRSTTATTGRRITSSTAASTSRPSPLGSTSRTAITASSNAQNPPATATPRTPRTPTAALSRPVSTVKTPPRLTTSRPESSARASTAAAGPSKPQLRGKAPPTPTTAETPSTPAARQRSLSTPGSSRQVTASVSVPPLPSPNKPPNAQAGPSKTQKGSTGPEQALAIALTPVSSPTKRPANATDRSSRVSLAERNRPSFGGGSKETGIDRSTAQPRGVSATPDRNRLQSMKSNSSLRSVAGNKARVPLQPKEPISAARSTEPTISKKPSVPRLGVRKPVDNSDKATAGQVSVPAARGIRTANSHSQLNGSTTAISSAARSETPSRGKLSSGLADRQRTMSSRSVAAPTVSSPPAKVPLKRSRPSSSAASTMSGATYRDASETNEPACGAVVTERTSAFGKADRSRQASSTPAAFIPAIVEPREEPPQTPPRSRLDTLNEDPSHLFGDASSEQLPAAQKVVLGLPLPGMTTAPASRSGGTPAPLPSNRLMKKYHPTSAFDPPTRGAAGSTPAHYADTPLSSGLPSIGADFGSSLSVGIPCIVAISLIKGCKFKAMTRYIGRIQEPDRPGQWVGVEVEQKILQRYEIGSTNTRLVCDGSIAGKQYFDLGVRREPTRRARHSNVNLAVPGPRDRSRSGHSTFASAPRSTQGARYGYRSASGSPVPGQKDEEEKLVNEKTKALFVRPNEVVFVLGASE